MIQQQIDDAARELGRELFKNVTAYLDLDDLRAIIQSIDNKFNANGVPGQTVSANMKNFAAPFNTAPDSDKDKAIAIWAKTLAGI